MSGSPTLLDGPIPEQGRPRFDWWREEVLDRFLPLDVTAVDASRFTARISDVTIGDMAVVGIDADPQHVRRGRREVARSEGGDWYLLVQEAGSAVVHAGDRSVEMSPGDVVVLDTAQPYVLDFPAHFRQTCVVIPRAWLDTSTDRRHGAALPRDAPATRAMRDLCQVVARHGPDLPVATSRHLIEAMVDVCRAALTPVSPTSLRESRLQALLHVIGVGSADPGFAPAAAAREMSLSIRYVHELLKPTGRSFGEHVRDVRLDRAVRMLTTPAMGDVTIAEIAYRAGFSDVSTFNRAVHQRYRTTPSAIRSRARTASSTAPHA
ncbi:helix-turn-helix domain-containing protein [Nitriliruptor alkaliphilus]|uniref:AraC-like ligand-binding domain-containing protein n=1 Tax=Nitriliruptor alkaliphilus TaxID=427918 RepID=UPI000697EC37|nr:helix-turn-helix domain-containing protein [Nitriliruptor alkaliphilus]